MNILVVTDNFPPVVGGVAVVGEMICRGLPPGDVCVLGPAWPGAEKLDAGLPYRVIRVRCRSARPAGIGRKIETLLGLLRMKSALKKILSREKFDVAYFTSIWPVGLLSPLAQRHGCATIIHVHGQEIVRPMAGFLGRKRAESLQGADRIVANSRWTKGQVLAHGVRQDNVTVIHPNIELEKFEKPVDVRAFKNREGLAGKRILLIVAHLLPNKGFDRIIRLLPGVLAEFPETVYVIVGEGPYREPLERLAADVGVADSVQFVGNRNVLEFFHACEVYVMTTLYDLGKLHLESFGITFLEANACKKPVIGSNIGGIPESVEDGVSGLLVDPEDSDAIAGVIERLLGDPKLCKQLGEQGFERVKEEFNHPIASQAFAEVLERLPRRVTEKNRHHASA